MRSACSPEEREEREPEAEDAPAVELALRILQDIAESRLVCASMRVKARRFLHRLERVAAEQAGQVMADRMG